MKLLLNSAAMLTVSGVAGSNIYFQWANAWIACLVALGAAFGLCLALEKVFIQLAYRNMRREYGKDWE